MQKYNCTKIAQLWQLYISHCQFKQMAQMSTEQGVSIVKLVQW